MKPEQIQTIVRCFWQFATEGEKRKYFFDAVTDKELIAELQKIYACADDSIIAKMMLIYAVGFAEGAGKAIESEGDK